MDVNIAAASVTTASGSNFFELNLSGSTLSGASSLEINSSGSSWSDSSWGTSSVSSLLELDSNSTAESFGEEGLVARSDEMLMARQGERHTEGRYSRIIVSSSSLDSNSINCKRCLFLFSGLFVKIK